MLINTNQLKLSYSPCPGKAIVHFATLSWKDMLWKWRAIAIILTMFFLYGAMTEMASAQNKHALLIGLSEYSEGSGWSSIHGENDILLLKLTMKGMNVTEMKGKKATYSNITNALKKLVDKTQSGDIVYIHLSGHGQPFEDKSGDEEDGWDESFVPYDAPQSYEEGVYEGEKHLTDDKLNQYLISLRQKAGKHGMVYVVVDACHSGGAYRDNEDEDSTATTNEEADAAKYERGTDVGFSKDKVYVAPKDSRTHFYVETKEEMSPIVVLEACLPGQRNCEIKRNGTYYGALSYSVASVLKNKQLNCDRTWVREVEKKMREVLPKWNSQTMVVEESK